MAEPSHPPSKMSINITRREDRSAYMFILQHVVKLFSTSLIKPRKQFPAGSPRLEVHKKAKKLCDVQEREVEGMYVYDLTTKNPFTTASESRPPQQGNNDINGEKSRRRLYYFAGGGWQMPASSEHWALCAELALKLPNTVVSVVSYPLAPNSPAPEAFPQLMKLYRRILEDAQQANETVILAGDSAGGNLILCMTLAALAEEKENGQGEDGSVATVQPCPAALLAISPSTDLRRHNPDIKVVEKHDPILNIPFINWTATNWRGQWEATDPRVTPLMADVAPLAERNIKVHGVVGRYDILGPDAVLFREKCNMAGVQGEWLDWDKQMHCFPLTFSFGLPEGVAAKDWMLNVLAKS